MFVHGAVLQHDVAQALPFRLDSSDRWRGALEAALQGIRSQQDRLHADEALLQQLTVQVQTDRSTLSGLEASIRDLLAAQAGAPQEATAAEDSAGLRIYCLGQFRISQGRQNVPLRSNGKSPTILKYLALNPREPVQRDVLLEALWPDTEPSTANNRLKVTIHNLRQALTAIQAEPGEVVSFQNGAYAFNPAVGVWTDIGAFEDNCRTGRRLERANQPAEAMAFYSRATALYQGDLLPDDAFEEWTLVRREELRESYLDVLGRLCRHWLHNGQTDAAIDGWKKILAKDPWREDAYRALMLCHVIAGQRSLALRWYNLCVQVLKEQLNLEPEEATVALYQRIRAGHTDWSDIDA